MEKNEPKNIKIKKMVDEIARTYKNDSGINFIDVSNLPARDKIVDILDLLTGENLLAGKLLYGSGLRLSECLRLRVKDIDFGQRQIVVRDGKGYKDRLALLPDSLQLSLKEQLTRVKVIHKHDLARGFGRVQLPHALSRKYPNADRQWIWQWVFPSSNISHDPRSGKMVRLHRSPSSLRKTKIPRFPRAKALSALMRGKLAFLVENHDGSISKITSKPSDFLSLRSDSKPFGLLILCSGSYAKHTKVEQSE